MSTSHESGCSLIRPCTLGRGAAHIHRFDVSHPIKLLRSRISAMYAKGDTIWLSSGTLSSSDIQDSTPAGAHAALHSPSRKGFPLSKRESLAAHPRLIYQMVITHAYIPFTMAVVCRVRLAGVFESPAAVAPHIALPRDELDDLARSQSSQINTVLANAGPEYILKLYDRRCFVNVREECAEGRPYSKQNAKAYQKYLNGTPAPYFTRSFLDMPGLREDDDWIDEEEWDENELGLLEAWLENDAVKTYQKEVSAYTVLADLQGDAIPTLFDTVSTVTSFICASPTPLSPDNALPLISVIETTGIATTQADCANPDDPNACGADFERSSVTGSDPDDETRDTLPFVDRHRVHGILIEYVPGPSLRSFVHSAIRSPDTKLRQELASIADEAVAVVLKISSYPVLNRDVRLDNMLVRAAYVSRLRLEGDGEAGGEIMVTPDSFSETAIHEPTISRNTSRCVAIDFSHSRLRFPDETDEQWRCAKSFYDEERLLVFALRYEIRGIFEKTHRASEGEAATGAGGEMASRALKDKCRVEQEAIWNYQQLRIWDRERSPEEHKEREGNASWGQHPNARD